MIDQNVQELLAQGSDLVHFAEEELNRAEGDVVTFLACNNIKRAINNYLQAFIQSNGLQPPLSPTPANLVRMCVSIDPSFIELNFDPLDCSHEKGANDFCLAVDHVKQCLDLAESTRRLVIDQIRV